MSNLYKSRFVINNNTGKRIIDSNEKATERMEDYIRLKREEALDPERYRNSGISLKDSMRRVWK